MSAAIIIIMKILKTMMIRVSTSKCVHIWKPRSAFEDRHQPLSFGRGTALHQHQQLSRIIIHFENEDIQTPEIPETPQQISRLNPLPFGFLPA